MNSERIRERFGSYFVEVLSQNGRQRLANLHSRDGDVSICRTLALTEFVESIPSQLSVVHSMITRGASIGQTLAEAGFEVAKRDSSWLVVPAGERFSSLSSGTTAPGESIAVCVYHLDVVVSGENNAYAVIAESYHPAHISCAAVKKTEQFCDERSLSPALRSAFETLREAL